MSESPFDPSSVAESGTPLDPAATDNTTSQEGAALGHDDPEPPSGVRGLPADAMDPGPAGGSGVGQGADGDTQAREALRKDLGERAAGTGEDPGGDDSDELTR